MNILNRNRVPGANELHKRGKIDWYQTQTKHKQAQIAICKREYITFTGWILKKEQKHIFPFYVINPHWHDTLTILLQVRQELLDSTQWVDVLATQGARASAALIFAMLNWINSVPSRFG